MRKTLIITFVILAYIELKQAQCNIWDNIFSQTQATSPIVLSQSISFKYPFDYNGIQMDALLDYNMPMKLLSATVSKPIIPGTFYKIDVMKAQVQLDSLILSIDSLLLGGCQRYKLVLNSTEKQQVQKIQLQSKLFLINLAFQFVSRNKDDRTMNQYVMKPDLLTQHTDEHDQYQINPLLVVNKDGKIVKIYEDQDKKKQIQFVLKSLVVKKLNCKSQIQQMTKQEIYKKIFDSIENKDYEKIPGFDKDKFKNIPGMQKFDFSKLPKPKQ